MSSSGYLCTIHGSYRKDLELVRLVAELFSFVGAEVLYPSSLEATNTSGDFVRFSKDTGTPAEIEHDLIETMRKHSSNPRFFAYFVNKDGYLGPSASYELSIAQETGAQVYALAQPKTLPLELSGKQVIRPVDVARKILFDN